MMQVKSTPTNFGNVAIILHWSMAVLILLLLGSGFRASSTPLVDAKGAILMIHATVGITFLILLIFRIVWWLFLDKKPESISGQPRWQHISSRFVHYAFYLIMIVMTASGISMFIISGAGPILFAGAEDTLPKFDSLAPRTPHGIGARLLIALVALHAGAAIYHQYICKDGLLSRMWFGHNKN